MNNILLIGGNGFIGEQLTKQLATNSKLNLHVVDRSLPDENQQLARVNYYRTDLTKTDDSLKSIINKIDIAVILTQPNQAIIKNIVNLLDQGKNLKKIIYVSSILIYPDAPGKQNEHTNPEPISDYEKGKHEEEILITKYCQKKNLHLCIPRLSNVYGGIKNRGIVSYIFQATLTDQILKINGNGEQKRDYIFVEDVTLYLNYLLVQEPKEPKEVFNICTGQGYTINELITAIEKITKKEINRVNQSAVPEKQTVIGDNQKILEYSGLKLNYNLIQGLKKTYNNFL